MCIYAYIYTVCGLFGVTWKSNDPEMLDGQSTSTSMCQGHACLRQWEGGFHFDGILRC